MRWSGPIPPKQDDTYRVMVVGDSLTYGDGLAEDRRFSNLLGQWLDKDYKIEFINLGHDGYQSEDVLATIKKYFPTIKPNLVFYAVCQNDFLPSAVGQYNPDGYPFPLPPAVKSFLIAHTYAGAFLNELYDSALRRLHLRADFFDDILKNFSDYQTRFGRDVAEMNQLVTSAGLPPIVAMVLDQFPSYGGRGHKITLIAEDLLNKAGAEVIPTENYYRKFNNRAMKISKWEGHPDEVANWIWATMIERKLIGRHQLKFFKRARNATSADRPSSSALTGP
jgi:hypothetical protein